MDSNVAVLPDTLQLWFTRVADSAMNAEQPVRNLLSDSERNRLESIKNNNKRREYLLSRSLMRHALSQHFQLQEKEWHFVERSGSAPVVCNLPENTYHSLSHSNGLICFALSDCPLGIDIETSNKQRNYLALAEVFMNDKELDYLAQNESTRDDNFYRTWCAKEAYFKALPATEQAATFLKQLSYSALIENLTEWRLIEGKTDTCRFAAVMKNKPQAINQFYFIATDNCSHSFCGLEIEQFI
jgi:4'-phosphopantetheinyl transferase